MIPEKPENKKKPKKKETPRKEPRAPMRELSESDLKQVSGGLSLLLNKDWVKHWYTF
jgi:bacteriocin-like protein